MLMVGLLNLFSGIWALCVVLPRYQRRVEAGEVLDGFRVPTLKACRRIGIGFLVIGFLSLLGWFLEF